MPDKKLTDAEIVKALECCVNNTDRDCHNCPFSNCDRSCVDELELNALDLINRLQEENERLKNTIDDVLDRQPILVERSEKYAKAEAYKECIEKVKERLSTCVTDTQQMVFELRLDNLLKELVGDNNG